MAYKTEIEIGVKGAERLRQLQKQVEKVSNAIDLLGARDLFENKALQNINTYNKALKEASRNLEAVKLGTLEETKAIKLYVDALGDANAAQSRQNAQIQQEITLRERAARIKELPTARPTTQYALQDVPFGPQPASFPSSPVAGRVQNLKTAQAAMIAAEKQVDKTRRSLEKQFFETQKRNIDFLTEKRIQSLDKQHKIALANSKKENDAALKDFDQRLAARGKAQERGRKGRQRLENIALGVGFPLLFGGGAGQALGGLAGSFTGGKGDFGGQIIGSAIGGAIETFISSASELGQALNEVAPDMDRLAEALGAVGNAEGRRLELLEKLRGESAAFSAAQEELIALVGQDGVNALKGLGDESIALSSEFSRFITIVQTGLAQLITGAGILAGLANQVSRAVASRQAETSQDPRLVALREERDSLGIGPGSVGRELEIRREMIDVQLLINQERFEENQAALAQLETENRLAEKRREQNKIDRELAAQARLQNQERITGLRVQQSGVQIQLNQLDNEQKIFGIRQQAATAGLQLEQARFDAELSTFQLQETRLKRELETLQKKGIAFSKQRKLIDQIAANQEKQAKIEFEVAKLRIRQNIQQAKSARQQIDFEVRRINLQLQMLRLKAMEESDEKRRAARLKEVNAAQKQANGLAKEMIKAADSQLKTAISIGKEHEKIANNILKGKLESIEAERVEARRAANMKQLASATGQAASEAARLNKNMSQGSGGGAESAEGMLPSGSPRGRTASTSMKIDKDVREAVLFGLRNTRISRPSQITSALDRAQLAKNKRQEQLARLANIRKQEESSWEPIDPNKPFGAKRLVPQMTGSNQSQSQTVNITTGPVMQFDDDKYVKMDDFESAINDLSRSQAASSRSYAGRKYGGVR